MYISKLFIWWIFRMWPQPWDQHTQNMSSPSVAPLMPHPRYWGLPALATKEKCFYVFIHYIIEIMKCVLPLYIYICFKKEVLGAYRYFCSGMYVLFQMILIDSHWWAVLFSPDEWRRLALRWRWILLCQREVMLDLELCLNRSINQIVVVKYCHFQEPLQVVLNYRV